MQESDVRFYLSINRKCTKARIYYLILYVRHSYYIKHVEKLSYNTLVLACVFLSLFYTILYAKYKDIYNKRGVIALSYTETQRL